MDSMTDSLPLLVVLGAALAVLAFFTLQHLADKRRTEKLRHVAEELGLPFYPDGDQDLIQALARFHLFSRGRSKKLRNMFHGDTNDVAVAVFDYQYTTGSGRSSHTWRQTVALFRAPALGHLPGFAIRPERFYHKIGTLFGYQDINFASHPRFSSRYLMRGGDEGAIREVFTDGVLSSLEATDGICLEGGSGCLVYYRPAKRVAPHNVRSFLDEAFGIYSLFNHQPESERLTSAPAV